MQQKNIKLGAALSLAAAAATIISNQGRGFNKRPFCEDFEKNMIAVSHSSHLTGTRSEKADGILGCKLAVKRTVGESESHLGLN